MEKEIKTCTKYGIILYIENSIHPFSSVYIFDLKNQISSYLGVLNGYGEFKKGDVIKVDIHSTDEEIEDYGFGECTKISTDSEWKEFEAYYKSLNIQKDEPTTTAISNFVNLIKHYLEVGKHLSLEASVISKGINELFNSQSLMSIKFLHHALHLFYNQYERDLDYPINELSLLFESEIKEEKKKRARLKEIQEEKERALSSQESSSIQQGGSLSSLSCLFDTYVYTGSARNYAQEIKNEQIERDEMYDNFQEERALYKEMKKNGVHY